MIIKELVKRCFELAGYRIISKSKKNYTNLAQAYEILFNEINNGNIKPNENRYELLARLLGTPPSEAYYLIHSLDRTKGVFGDVCEFGVAQGETSALIANEIFGSLKNLHLFDSFAGLSKPTEKDELKDDIFNLGKMESYTGTMSYPEKNVKERLQAISFPRDRYMIHKGFIEQVLKSDDNLPQLVSFAYVDFHLYEPIKTTLEFLENHTSSGAIIIVDDYNYFSTGVKTAVDEWLLRVNEKTELFYIDIPDSRFGDFVIIYKK